MARTVSIPGSRDVRASLDEPDGADADEAPSGLVVALPPHPQMGGSRSNRRLRAVSTALTAKGWACCRVDYGPWTGGEGEVTDARAAVEWASDRYDRVGLFGYSFGAGVAVCAAAEGQLSLAALAVLAPPASVGDALDVADRMDAVECPVGVWYGTEDRTVDWEPVVERARALGHRMSSYPGGHHVAPHTDDVAAEIATFVEEQAVP